MKQYGSKIDGPVLETEQLLVRGVDLITIIREKRFIEAVYHLLNGCFPDDKEYEILEDFCKKSILLLSPDHNLFRVIREISQMTNNPVNGLIGGLLFDLDKEFLLVTSNHPVSSLFEREDKLRGLFLISILPVMTSVALDSHNTDNKTKTDLFLSGNSEGSFAELIYRTLISSDPASNSSELFESLLNAWHAGFGFLTPSVLAARVAAGTGASINMSLIAGYASSGPYHIGASQAALIFITKLLKCGDDEIRDHVSSLLKNKKIIFGFGHPLLCEDPRPAVLRNIWMAKKGSSRCLQIYDLVCETVADIKSLKPNIDFITAAILVDLGIIDHYAAPLISLYARSVAMVAHADEKKQKPSFGAKSKDSREFLMRNKITEISFE